MKISIFIIAIISGVLIHKANAEQQINYPDGYRHWVHVKTLTLHKGHNLANPFEGIHHVYANTEAARGLKNKQYDDGAVFVFDLLENNTMNHASAEGKRKLLGVMVKDRRRFDDTGGWGFEAWEKNSRVKRLTNDKGRSCFGCHRSQKNNNYVFSQWRD